MDPLLRKYLDNILLEISSLKLEIASIKEWPKIQIEKLKYFQSSFVNTKTQNISSGFFFLEFNQQQNLYYPHLGTTYHSFAVDVLNNNSGMVQDKFDVSINTSAKTDVFQAAFPPLPADYFHKNEFFFSYPNNYDFLYLKFAPLSPKDPQQADIWKNYVLDLKTQMALGEKVVVLSSGNQDLKISLGHYVGDKEKKKLITMDGIGGFSGAIASNGTSFIGIVTGEKTLGNDFSETRNLQGANQYGKAFVDALSYEAQHKKSFTCVSMISEWIVDQKGKDLINLNII